MQREFLSPCTQQPTAGQYPEPAESTSKPHKLFDGEHHDVLEIDKPLNKIYVKHKQLFLLLFIVYEVTCFDLLIRSSSGLLSSESKDVIYVLGSKHVYLLTYLLHGA